MTEIFGAGSLMETVVSGKMLVITVSGCVVHFVLSNLFVSYALLELEFVQHLHQVLQYFVLA